MVAPLTRPTSTLKPFGRTQEAEAAFSHLKSLFICAPILVHPDPNLQFVVEVEAPSLCSRRLTPTEQNYDVGKWELLAMVLALQEWRYWLEGFAQSFVVWTDHKNIAYLQSAKQFNSWQAHWALFLGCFHFTLTYWPGSRNIKPDALSRQFSLESSGAESAPILPPSCIVAAATWTVEERVPEAQQSHPSPTGTPHNRLFVPESVQYEVLQWAHSSKLSCQVTQFALSGNLSGGLIL